MAHIWDESQRDDSSADPEHDFESFLRRKVEQCTQDVPTSQLTTTALDQSESSSLPANTVEEGFGSTTSEATPETSLPSELPLANVAEEKVTEYSISDAHPVAGRHVVERQVTLRVDEEWVRISNESYNKAVVDMTPLEIIQRQHDLNKLRFLIPAQQFGLQNALEELLKKETAENRAKYTALISENVKSLRARSQPKEGTPKKARDKKVGSGATGAVSGKGQKVAKQFHTMGFDAGFTETKLKEQGLWNDNVEVYVKKLYAS
jgi:hypothetical protein